MWIIILKTILAIISIFTGGAIFYRYIKDNKLAVFLAGSISILSAVYLFMEIKKDIKNLNEPTQSSSESEASAPNTTRLKPSVPNELESETSVPKVPSSKWITPSDSDCESNGGKVENNGCKANWDNANKICEVSGERLATVDELRKVIMDCGKDMNEWDNSKNNSVYQFCYKNKGFSSSYYWSSSMVGAVDNEEDVWIVDFSDGYTFGNWSIKSSSYYVRCVRNQY